MRRPRLPILAILVLLPAAARGDGEVRRPLPPEPARSAAIDEKELLWTAAWLSDDARGGRQTGTAGCRDAARWIAQRMDRIGLESPAGPDGRFQGWALPLGEPEPEGCALAILREGAEPRTFLYGKEFVTMVGSGAGDLDLPLVFAGYGIRSPEPAYDDYLGLPARGKAVLVLRHEPREKDGKSRWNGDKLTMHSAFAVKMRAARDAGAAAVIFVNDPLNHEGDPVDGFALGTPRDAGIPALFASRAFAEAALQGSGTTLYDLQKRIDDGDAPASRELPGVRVRLKAAMRHPPTENVAGILRGSDPVLREEWIVVGAHYDHVGTGETAGLDRRRVGEIHNGADDNASGTAAMLEIAEWFALGKERPRRSLLFLAFSGEEMGLLGSAWYVAHPLVPMDRVAAMINLDMVGRYRPGAFDVVGADSGSTLRETVKKASEGLELDLNFTNAGMGLSDGLNFYDVKVPTLFLFTGTHEDYHRPGDDWWRLDAAGAVRVTTLAARVARALADADARPAFQALPTAEFALDRRNRPLLGVGIGDDDEEPGAQIERVSAGSPAAEAGIRAGDRVVGFGGRPIRGSRELREAIGRVRPGEAVPLRVARGGVVLEMQARFPGPPGPIFGVVFDETDDGQPGALVREVAKGSVAEGAGVKAGDRVLAFGARAVPGNSALGDALRSAKAGDVLPVKVLRDGKEIVLEARYPK